MTDVIPPQLKGGTSKTHNAVQRTTHGENEDNTHFELMELLFFAYRDFISDPDQILQNYGFGRAHHRVLHFVLRHPGIRIAELLDILKITKQSLAGVLKQLINEGFVYQREGDNDRRQRLLYVTNKGQKLTISLAEPQLRRINLALEKSGKESKDHLRVLLHNLINASEREQVKRWIGRK
jgi:DNA-binding MarR family transcriptional regulator